MALQKQEWICDELERRIEAGAYKDGFPSSSILAREFNINSRTINKALSRLVLKGLLTKRRGYGAVLRDERAGAKTRILVKCAGRIVKESSYYSAIYKGASDAAAAASCELTLLDDLSHVRDFDGVLFLGQKERERHMLMLREKIPFVVVEDNINPEISSVCADVHPTIYRIIKRLLESGITRIAYIGMTTSRTLLTDIEKFRAYLEAIDDVLHTIDFALVRHAWPEPEYAYRAMSDILSKSGPPQAVFVTSDYVAPGVYRALSEKGFKIPEDVQILSCDCLGMDMLPSLASIAVPKYELGAQGLKLLLEMVREPGRHKKRKLRIPTSFEPGGSLPAFPDAF